MGDKSAIEWTDSTWNAVTGCTEVSPGCDHCYARTLAHTKLKTVYGARLPVVDTPENRADTFSVRLWPERLGQPLSWRKPRMIFVNSMSDFFHADVPDSYRDQMYAVMALAPRHTFQILTKRPARAARYLVALTPERVIDAASEEYGEDAWMFAGNWIDGWSNPQEAPQFSGPCDGSMHRWPLPNVWLGATVENQDAAYRVRHLASAPAAVRFLSCEPLLGPLELDLSGIDWLIAGGESGPGFRPVHPDWIRSLRDQCLAAGTAFHFKQWGGARAKSGGRELDGRTWDEFPAPLAAEHAV